MSTCPWVSTDGGCQHQSYGSRAGLGVYSTQGTLRGAVEGSIQTAQRAEVRAVLAAVQGFHGKWRLCSDSKYVVDTLNKQKEVALRAGAPHLDVWKLIWERRSFLQEARWIKPHLTWEEANKGGWAWDSWKGNVEADKLANLGVSSHIDDLELVGIRQRKVELAARIQQH